MANWSDNSTCMAGLQVGSGIVEEHTCMCGALEDGQGNQMHSTHTQCGECDCREMTIVQWNV